MLSEAEQLQLDLGPFLILTFFNALYVDPSSPPSVAHSDVSLYGILCLQCYLFLQTSFNHVRGTLVNYSVCASILIARYD